MACHSSILAWKTTWTEEPTGYSPRGHKELDTVEQLSTQLMRSMVLVSATQQLKSGVWILISTLCKILFPYRLLQSIE